MTKLSFWPYTNFWWETFGGVSFDGKTHQPINILPDPAKAKALARALHASHRPSDGRPFEYEGDFAIRANRKPKQK